jgi:hypothetical protein
MLMETERLMGDSGARIGQAKAKGENVSKARTDLPESIHASNDCRLE